MGVHRMRGISQMFGHPNALAATTVFSLPAWYFLFRRRDSISLTWPSIWRKWFRRAIWIYPLLAISSVVLTNSRGGMGALILFGGITVLRGSSMRRKVSCAAAVVAIACVAWTMMDTASRDRFRSIWDPEASTEDARTSAEGRTEGFRAGMQIFREFPITGVGIGNFIAYRVRFIDGINLAAHNLPSQVLGETGLLGTGCFLMMVVATFVNCRRTTTIARENPDETTVILSELARAVRDTTLLALFCGVVCHNLYWFNWLWFGAFAMLSVSFACRRQMRFIAACEPDFPSLH
jgi:O-antigen ligase